MFPVKSAAHHPTTTLTTRAEFLDNIVTHSTPMASRRHHVRPLYHPSIPAKEIVKHLSTTVSPRLPVTVESMVEGLVEVIHLLQRPPFSARARRASVRLSSTTVCRAVLAPSNLFHWLLELLSPLSMLRRRGRQAYWARSLLA